MNWVIIIGCVLEKSGDKNLSLLLNLGDFRSANWLYAST